MVWKRQLLVKSLALAVVLASIAHAEKDETLEAFEGQKECDITGALPRRPRALSFCNRYNDKACCVPGIDVDNHVYFSELTDVGLSCRLRGDIREHPLARFYCLNCDPNQPRYVRPVEYESPDGDDERDRDDTILICKNWADSQFGDLSRFDACGLLISVACMGENEIVIPERDRYMCGDDVEIPSKDRNDSLTDTQNVELFLNFPSLGPPEIDLDFGFKVVENRPCTDDEADADESPDCLLTAAQMQRHRYRYAEVPANPEDCEDDDYYNDHPEECVEFMDEMCFQSTSAASGIASSIAIVLAAMVALAF